MALESQAWISDRDGLWSCLAAGEAIHCWCAPQDKPLWVPTWSDQIWIVDGDLSLIVTSKKMVDPSQYLVTDGHIYKRIDMPNAPSKQWRLEELNIEELEDVKFSFE